MLSAPPICFWLNEQISSFKGLWNVCSSCKTCHGQTGALWVLCLLYRCPGTWIRSPPAQRRGTPFLYRKLPLHRRESSKLGSPLEEGGHCYTVSAALRRLPLVASSGVECFLSAQNHVQELWMWWTAQKCWVGLNKDSPEALLLKLHTTSLHLGDTDQSL